jgi:hypothetical protein
LLSDNTISDSTPFKNDLKTNTAISLFVVSLEALELKTKLGEKVEGTIWHDLN